MKNPCKVLIKTCWCLLIICCFIKLLGFNLFEPIATDKNFILVCNFIDNNVIVKYILYCIIAIFLHSLCILAILKQKFYDKKQIFIYIPLIITMSLISWYNSTISTILNFLFYLLPIFKQPKKWYRSIIGIALILLFQIISIITKNIGLWNLNEESAFVTLILQIDAVIMSLLYYLYNNKDNYGKE